MIGDGIMKKSEIQLTRIVFGAVMAALVFVVTLFRFPLLGSKVHFANAVCLLCGLLPRAAMAAVYFVSGNFRAAVMTFHRDSSLLYVQPF